jgi:hypothetical protein
VQTKKKSASKAKAKPKTLKKSGEPLPKKKLATKKVLASKVATKVIMPPEFTMKQVKEIVALIKDAGAFTTFGYKTEELAKLLATLKNQGYSVNDLEKMLKKLLTEGYDPNLINKILEQLLKDRLKALQDAIKK